MEPSAPPADVLADVSDNEAAMQLGDRRWRVRGLSRNTGFGTLKVYEPVSESGGAFHVDTVDLYSVRAREAFARQAADVLGLEEHAVKGDVGRVLMRLEGFAAEAIRKAQGPEHRPDQLGDQESAAALDLLRDPGSWTASCPSFDRPEVVGGRRTRWWLHGGDVEKARSPAGGDCPVGQRCREVRADGRGALAYALDRSGEGLGDDRAGTVLHGRARPGPQDPGGGRGRTGAGARHLLLRKQSFTQINVAGASTCNEAAPFCAYLPGALRARKIAQQRGIDRWQVSLVGVAEREVISVDKWKPRSSGAGGAGRRA